MDFLLSPPTGTHGTSRSSNFAPPPLDGSLTVPELYDWHSKYNADHPVFLYADSGGKLTRLTFARVVPAAHRAARYVADAASIDLMVASPTPKIAILAGTDTITYFTTLVGVLRAGIVAFPISPRNSAAAVAHLLIQTTPSHVFISPEDPIRDLVTSALSQIELSHPHLKIGILAMPTYDAIYRETVSFEPLSPRRHDYTAPRLIVHSSGSTSFPKPIVWNDKSYLQDALVPLFGAHDLCGEVIACHSVAMFHAIGLNLIAWLPATGLTLATFAPASPAVIPTPESVFQGILHTSPSYALGVPAFIESWYQDPNKVLYMKEMKGVIYGGSPLDKSIGDALSRDGVHIYTLYGATEVGVIGAVLAPKMGADWEYTALNPHCAAEFIPTGDGSYELVVVEKPTQVLNIYNTTFHGQNAFTTNDLLVPHPTKSGYWKVVGRKDDQIILSTGEKTNPVPLESIICQHPQVKAAVMFGRGKFQNGVLIQPEADFVFDPKDTDRLAEFRNEIWPDVEKMNNFSPSHSRLFKELILVVDPAKPFIYTPKGAPKRSTIIQMYDEEIAALYATLEETTQAEIGTPEDWSLGSVLAFVRTAVNNVLKHDADDDEDIFQCGCDSLQAVWVRNTILHGLRTSGKAPLIPPTFSNVVYEHPTIASLANYVCHLAQAGNEHPKLNPGSTITDLASIVARYTVSFPTHIPGDVVLVTGTTGSLGAAVLAKLVENPAVAKVYALNRPSGSPLDMPRRQKDALKSRGYNEEVAISPKVSLIEGKLSGTGLGIECALENEIRRTVTHIIHIAWPVNFKLSISSFENSIGGVRSLINLALQSPLRTPPRLIFISSVGVLRNIQSSKPIRETPLDDPGPALGQGYSESKWVAETMLQEASKYTALRPIVIRVGQISGGLNGAWNTSDWVPSLIKTSLTLGCLPDVKGTVSWIPLDLAAKAVVEMRDSEDAFAHLAHPCPTEWANIFNVVAKELSLPLRPFSQWYEALEASVMKSESDQAAARASIPAGLLLEFFKVGLDLETTGTVVESMGLPSLNMTYALRASQALRDARSSGPLNNDAVQSWIAYWRDIGFLPTSQAS